MRFTVQISRLSFLILFALLLAACEQRLDLYVENHVGQKVIGECIGTRFAVAPCSVHLVPSVLYPPGHVSLQAAVTSSDGTITYQTKVYRHGYQVTLVIQPDGESECPDPISDEIFMLVVSNDSKTTLGIDQNGIPLGQVPPQAEVTFGPLQGTPHDPGRLRFYDADDPKIEVGAVDRREVDYELGQVPAVRFAISTVGW